MSHFIAFYRCYSCKQPIAGLVSDTMLVISGADRGIDLINPREIKIKEELKVFCPQCIPQFETGKIECKCCICANLIELFYLPKEVTVIKPDSQRIVARTETLLMEYPLGAICSIKCLKKRRQDDTAEPDFLEFQKLDEG